MSEEDFIELQELLIKLRVEHLKKLNDKSMETKRRDAIVKNIRAIDTLRNMDFKFIKTLEIKF